MELRHLLKQMVICQILQTYTFSSALYVMLKVEPVQSPYLSPTCYSFCSSLCVMHIVETIRLFICNSLQPTPSVHPCVVCTSWKAFSCFFVIPHDLHLMSVLVCVYTHKCIHIVQLGCIVALYTRVITFLLLSIPLCALRSLDTSWPCMHV